MKKESSCYYSRKINLQVSGRIGKICIVVLNVLASKSVRVTSCKVEGHELAQHLTMHCKHVLQKSVGPYTLFCKTGVPQNLIFFSYLFSE